MQVLWVLWVLGSLIRRPRFLLSTLTPPSEVARFPGREQGSTGEPVMIGQVGVGRVGEDLVPGDGQHRVPGLEHQAADRLHTGGCVGASVGAWCSLKG